LPSILEPFLLSLIAGAATGLGGLLVFFLGSLSDRVVSFLMGLASGVMLLVAFIDLFFEAMTLLSHFEIMAMFSLGAITIMALDLAIPHIELTTKSGNGESHRLLKTGMLVALGITIHNFPEGLVVAAGYSHIPRMGLVIAIAIMLHNIPEGIATAVPLTVAGMNRLKIVMLTLLSGLSEPLAAFVGAVIFSFVGSKSVVGSSLAFAASVMTYLTADELLPVACEYGHKHTVSVGLLVGMMFAILIDALLS